MSSRDSRSDDTRSDDTRSDERDPGALTSNDLTSNDSASSEEAHGQRPATPAPTRRHLAVLALAVVGLIVGITLVITGRDRPQSPKSSAPVSTVASPLLPDLGAVADDTAAHKLLEQLDPATLRRVGAAPQSSGSAPVPAPPSGGVSLTEAGLQRCQVAVVQQNTDRSLGSRLAGSRLMMGTTPAFVVSFAVPASGSSPRGTRILLVDARTCRVLGAVDHG